MANILGEKSVTSFLSGRNIEDPTEKGLKKLCNTQWVHDTLARSPVDEDTEEERYEVDLDYEIADVN